MAATRWLFTKSQLSNTPSRKNGIDSDKELSYRQQAANLIQDMGQRLQVTQLCINTAIVYMHRFYMFQSFTRFPRNEMAPACLFLAAKVEEQPRKLEHVIRVAHTCLHRDNTPPPDPKSEVYLDQAQTLVINENILLQSLGFEITVDHPHTQVVKTCQLVKASKDLAQTSYFLATNSLHLTSFCLQYRPTIVACVCIHLACKWSSWEIPRSSEGKEWYYYIDTSVTLELLEDLTAEFLNILEKCPSKLRKKIMGWKAGNREGMTYDADASLGSTDPKRSRQDPSGSSGSKSASQQSHHHKHTNHDRKDVRPQTESRPHHPTSASTTSSSSSSAAPHPHVKAAESHTKLSAKSETDLHTGHSTANVAASASLSLSSQPTPDVSDHSLAGNAELKRVKSEQSVLNYKAYIQRKEKEKHDVHQPPVPATSASLSSLSKSIPSSLNDTGERKHKHQKVDAGLPSSDVNSSRSAGTGSLQSTSHPNSSSSSISRTSQHRDEIPTLKFSIKHEQGADSASPRVVQVKHEPALASKEASKAVKIEQQSSDTSRVSGAQQDQTMQSQAKPSHSRPEGNPPIKLHIKQSPGSGGTPKRLHVKDPLLKGSSSSHELHRDGSSPLKMKIKTTQLHKGSEQKHGERHHRHGEHGHREKGKHSHRDKNSHSKSHKHSHSERDNPETGSNGKPNLKLHIKMSDIKGPSLSNTTNDSKSSHKHSQKHGQAATGTDINSNTGQERSQPWSVSELMTQSSTSHESSPAKKRRRTQLGEPNSAAGSENSANKVPKSESQRLKRSSSSHSVVSMDLSDTEPNGESNGSGKGSPPHLQANQQSIVTVNQQLQQLIDMQAKRIAHTLQQQQHHHPPPQGPPTTVERQQSLFDIDSYCYPGANPPLPPDTTHAPLPPSPPRNPPPPPPPPPL